MKIEDFITLLCATMAWIDDNFHNKKNNDLLKTEA